jgi:hypothetical protein
MDGAITFFLPEFNEEHNLNLTEKHYNDNSFYDGFPCKIIMSEITILYVMNIWSKILIKTNNLIVRLYSSNE